MRRSRSLRGSPDEYGIAHRPAEDGAPLHDLTQDVPADVYRHPDWYTGFPEWLPEVMPKVRGARGRPSKAINVFRAGPTEELNNGDWISLSKSYTNAHRDREDPNSYKTCSFTVDAREVRFAGDDLMEWGYFGPARKATGCQKKRKSRRKP